MPAGRKPKPTALKEISGNPGKRKLNSNEPKFSCDVTCPAWLTHPAKKEWKRVVKELDALGLIQSVDRAALAAYCLSYARWQAAEETVTREGQTVKEPILDKHGKLLGHKTKRHPATNIAKDERTSMLKAASLFGFDPSSRSRLSMPGGADKDTDPFTAFMQEMGAGDEMTSNGESETQLCAASD
jgi:P27 family predicted phage terminase small subunit